MATKTKHRSGAGLADSFCAVFYPQGSFATRTTVRPLVEKLTAWRGNAFEHEGWDALVADTLDHLIAIEWKHEPATPRTAWVELTYFINHSLGPEGQARLSGLFADRCPIVVGPRVARDPFIWGLKREAFRRGSLFEIAETPAAAANILGAWLALTARGEKPRPPESTSQDAIKGLPGIISAVAQFRSERGRLHADKLRELFGLTRPELLALAGVSMTEQAIAATPDSEKLQPFLEKLERCARLLVMLRSRTQFATWLNTANPELDGAKPIEMVRSGKAEMIADLVEDILTNRRT